MNVGDIITIKNYKYKWVNGEQAQIIEITNDEIIVRTEDMRSVRRLQIENVKVDEDINKNLTHDELVGLQAMRNQLV